MPNVYATVLAMCSVAEGGDATCYPYYAHFTLLSIRFCVVPIVEMLLTSFL